MVTTVTTVTTVITVVGITTIGAAIAIVVVASLMLFLCIKELASASQSLHLRLISRQSTVGIIPLLMVFAAIAVVKIFEVLA